MSMPQEKILFVDDDLQTLKLYRLAFRQRNNVATACDGKEGFAMLQEQGPFAVIISDLNMVEMNGVDFLHEAKVRSPDSVRLILTGNAEIKTAIELVNEANIFRFLTKPCSPQVLMKAVDDAVKQYRLVVAERDILERTLSGSIRVVTELLSMIDPPTFDRAIALKQRIGSLATELNAENTWELEMAAMLSRIGCVTIPPDVLKKSRARTGLERAEQDLINRVPEIGRNLLANIPRLESVSQIVFYQNKNFDGSGFPPEKIAGEAIPLGARILRVVNDLSESLWAGKTLEAAFQGLRDRNGFYDPRILEAAAGCFQKTPIDGTLARCLQIPARDLQVGHRLLSNIETHDGTLLLCAGSEVSLPILERIRNFAQLAGIKEPLLVRGGGN